MYSIRKERREKGGRDGTLPQETCGRLEDRRNVRVISWKSYHRTRRLQNEVVQEGSRQNAITK